MLDNISLPHLKIFLFKFEVVSLAVAAASISYSVVQWWRILDFTEVIVSIRTLYACVPLLKFTSAVRLKCLYGFLSIPFTEISPLSKRICIKLKTKQGNQPKVF